MSESTLSEVGMKLNERQLPYLDQRLINLIFAGVYQGSADHIVDEQLRDYLDLLYTMQRYNARYRLEACAAMRSLFEAATGRVGRDPTSTTPWFALGLAIRELYGMRSSTLKGLLGFLPPHRDEDDILITCALRFQGYEYQAAHPFDQEQALNRFFETGEWDLSPLAQLAEFFLLQRYLFKWGGEQLTRESREWRAFRDLFLATCRYDIPVEYQHPEYHGRWERDFRPHVDAYEAQIRQIHETIEYQTSTER